MVSRSNPASIASLVDDPTRIQTYAAELHRVIKTADAAAPAGASASDSTGVAQAAVDHTGMPTSLRIAERWERQLSAAELGPALVEAYQTLARFCRTGARFCGYLEIWRRSAVS